MATIRRNHNSKAFILLYKFPIEPTLKAMNHANKITGIPVARAKTNGRYKPLTLLMVMGISIPK